MDIFLIFLAGISTALGPCILTVLPIVLIYTFSISNSRLEGFLVSLSFVIGFSVVFSLLGVLSSAFGMFLNLSSIKYIVGIITIIFGLSILLNRGFTFRNSGIFQKVFEKMKDMGEIPIQHKILNSLILGIFYGFGANLCADPILAGVLTYVASKADIYFGFLALLIYSLGYGLPIIFLSTLGTEGKKIIEKITKTKILGYISGIILLALGFYLILK